MKTAEQWLESWDGRNVAPENVELHLSILRQIQQDAITSHESALQARVEQLENALDHALDVIEAYQPKESPNEEIQQALNPSPERKEGE